MKRQKGVTKEQKKEADFQFSSGESYSHREHCLFVPSTVYFISLEKCDIKNGEEKNVRPLSQKHPKAHYMSVWMTGHNGEKFIDVLQLSLN